VLQQMQVEKSLHLAQTPKLLLGPFQSLSNQQLQRHTQQLLPYAKNARVEPTRLEQEHRLRLQLGLGMVAGMVAALVAALVVALVVALVTDSHSDQIQIFSISVLCQDSTGVRSDHHEKKKGERG
jgi:hypothetical protein